MSITSIETQPELSDDDSLYNLRKELFKAAMNREWKEVLKLYENEKVQGEHITHANDTLLHVAVSGATENVVLDLLAIVKRKDRPEILKIKNKVGDTPLHLAAALGLDKVCSMIAKMCPDMVTSERNNLQETPLFSAVCHGNKNAFFELEVAILEKQNLTNDENCLRERDISHCRRGDGNNILHYAIKGGQFDLAYDIIHLYPKLVNYFNSSGETALHTLANEPSVFKSGSRFGLYDKIIYHCTITEPLKYHFGNLKARYDELPGILQKDENKLLQRKYQVCIDIFSLMKKPISCLFKTDASCSKSGIYKACCDDVENPSSSSEPVAASSSKTVGEQKEPRRMFPQNYDMMILFFKMIVKLLLVVLGIGFTRLQTITEIKQQHRNAKKIMKELVEKSTLWEYEEASGGQKPVIDRDTSFIYELPPVNSSAEATDQGLDKKTLKPSEGKTPVEPTDQRLDDKTQKPSEASPVLLAAKNGITEMVKKILKKYPVAVMDKDQNDKNIILLAVEHRQVHVYMYMLDFQTGANVFRKVDNDGNTALHLAAKLSESRPWSIPGEALQMQWESKWYKYVHSNRKMNREIFSRTNKEKEKPEDVFIKSHKELVKAGSDWLTKTSESCSVIAALVATVAFASSSAVPGGVNEDSGFPVLSTKPVFQLFAISSLVALCFSVTSLVMFLSILTSRYEVRDFNRGLPVKLILGLTSLFMSIAAMLVSFCAGDFFVVENKLKFAVYPIYAVMCFPVTFFAVAQLPLYIDLMKATIKNVPEPTEKVHIY